MSGWTTKAPTEPGFYWLKMLSVTGRRPALTVVSLQKDPDGYVVCFPGDDHAPHPYELKDVEWWTEPIRKPE